MGSPANHRSLYKALPPLFLMALSNFFVSMTTWYLSSSSQMLLPSFTDQDVDYASPMSSRPEEVPIASLSYVPSSIEAYFMERGVELGLNVQSPEPSGCIDWNNQSSPIFADLQLFRAELNLYNMKMAAFHGTVKDIREHIAVNHSICDTLQLHPEGLRGIFSSGTLTQTSNGLVEPIFPPMRHPAFCKSESSLMSLEYLVHDFSTYCRRLKQTSRIVLVDMGASLDFHGSAISPAMSLTKIYQRFGFHFDHIYAYEISKKKPEQVFKQIPADLYGAYHWINVGVSRNPNSVNNPWKLIRETYNEDDLVVIKLDIDNSQIEVAITRQLLKSPELVKLVDAFYFEHHVHIKELSHFWAESMSGSLLDSIRLFTDLRRAGVSAHSWV